MLTRLFRQTAVPKEYHANFLHLYMDVAWFGILSGSIANFLNIYATRIGATGFQIGLIGAMAAIVTLFLSIPTGRWLQTQNTGKAIFWASVYYRVGYIPFIFLPMLTNKQGQIWAIIAITFLMAIPLTTIGVGFNALFAEAVPLEYRAHVAGIRNVTLAVTYMITSLISGYILNNVEFPRGYQIVFAIGTIGAAMSSVHLYFVRPFQVDTPALPVAPLPPALTLRPYARALATTLRLDIWNTPFRNVLLALFAFHLTQSLPLPLFPLYNVRVLKLTDDHIGIGTALFYLTVLLGSTQLRRIAHNLGNKKLTGWSVSSMALYPLALAFSTTVWHFYGVSLVGGLTFAMVSGSYANYMLENIPAHDRPSHLAWYNIILNIAVLVGSLVGSAVGDSMGLT
ncbi:MAG TPA: MFS transporter, partial [Anaerolineales bacterium]|nr:MFS transporter [Anaerolineales bacterium]